MILLDPDLDPDPAPKPAKPSAAPRDPKSYAATIDKELRVPAARTLARFLAAAQVATRLKGQVNVLLTTDAAIRRLNRQFRNKNKATDVLSFPAMPVPGIKGAIAFAGDLAISVPTARKQAIAQGHSLGIEIKVLILHGLLHLAGYDHETDSGQMARREAELRAQLKLPSGLIERAFLRESSTIKMGAPSLRRSSVARVGGRKAEAVRSSRRVPQVPRSWGPGSSASKRSLKA